MANRLAEIARFSYRTARNNVLCTNESYRSGWGGVMVDMDIKLIKILLFRRRSETCIG